VHDWLYYYIYLDLYRLSPKLPKMRFIAQLSTFVISAIIHELIIYYSIGFFYPILFILFAGPGNNEINLGILFVQVSSLRTNSINLIFWLEMYIGTAIMFTLYLVECFARNKVS
jgi:sterol O-acyltransferase